MAQRRAAHPLMLQITAAALIGALALLTVGFRTRLATLVVLITGVILVGTFYSYKSKIDHGNTFLVAYIPAIMLFSRWHTTYSVDALLKKRRTGITVNPDESSWAYIWPQRAVLLLLALMFFGAGYLKIRAGQWLTDPQVMANALLSHNVVAITRGIPANPLNPVLAGIPVIAAALQLAGIAFETFFPLALINQRIRSFFMASAVVFHAFNYYFLTINASEMVIVYLLFVDWQALYARWWPFRKLRPALERLPAPALIGLSLVSAAVAMMLWATANPVRGLFGYPQFWLIATPIALFVMIRSAFAVVRHDIVGSLQRYRKRRQSPQPAPPTTIQVG